MEGLSMGVFPGISMDAKIRFGKACIAGTRIDVATILGGLASGSNGILAATGLHQYYVGV